MPLKLKEESEHDDQETRKDPWAHVYAKWNEVPGWADLKKDIDLLATRHRRKRTTEGRQVRCSCAFEASQWIEAAMLLQGQGAELCVKWATAKGWSHDMPARPKLEILCAEARPLVIRAQEIARENNR